MREHQQAPSSSRSAGAGAGVGVTTATDAAAPIFPPGENWLLATMPREEYARLEPHLEPVTLGTMEHIVDLGGELEHAYFPTSAVISVVRPAGDGTYIETGTIGCEGVVGLGILFGPAWSAATLEAQVPGACLRIRAEALRQVLDALPVLRASMGTFALTFFDQIGQSVVCNSRHSLAQRCARWLLMAHDRVQGDTLQLTHEVLAQMLDVRRAGVTEAAVALKRAGVISYTRGKVTILDRAGLEAAACDCYAINRGHLDTLYARLQRAVSNVASNRR